MASQVSSLIPKIAIPTHLEDLNIVQISARCAELGRKCKDMHDEMSLMPPQNQVRYADTADLTAISKELPKIENVVESIQTNNIFAKKIVSITNKLYGLFEEHPSNINKIESQLGHLQKQVRLTGEPNNINTVEKLGRLQKQVVRLKSQKQQLNGGNRLALKSLKKAIESVRGVLTSEQSIPRAPSDPDPAANENAIGDAREMISPNLSMPGVDSGPVSAAIITESIKKALESVRVAITSDPSIPRVVSLDPPAITELSEKPHPSSHADFESTEVLQKMEATNPDATKRTGRLNLEIPSDESILWSVQRSLSVANLHGGQGELGANLSSEVNSSNDDDDSQEIEMRIRNPEQVTERQNTPIVSKPSSPKITPDPIPVNTNASPLLTERKKVDSSDPLLIPEQITNLILQMQTSSVISPEKKKEMTQVILQTLLGESSVIEPVPLPAVMNPSPITHIEKEIDGIQELENLLSLFQNSSPQDYRLALDHLLLLGSKKVKLPIIGSLSADVVGRIFFHLYSIHKERFQSKLVKDRDYGRNAMRGVHPTTHDERIRSIMRTIAEFALQKLEDAVNANRLEDVHAALNTLEGLKMSSSDMPPGKDNLTFALFGKMYDKQVEARKAKPTLVDPCDWPKFRGDFGRKAFSVIDGIDIVDKIAVIKGLYQELKKVWQIP